MANLTTEQRTNLCWISTTGISVSLNNGVSSFNYPDPSGVVLNSNQYVIIQDVGLIKQSINITQTGNYHQRSSVY